MSTMQDYHSRLSDPASRKFGTFSYLPPMSAQELRKQVADLTVRSASKVLGREIDPAKHADILGKLASEI